MKISLHTRSGTSRQVEVKPILAVVLAIFLTMPVQVSGTQIVVVVAPNFIVMAADSLVTGPDGRSDNECKIRQTGKLFWSAGGLTADDRTHYTVDAFFTKGVGQLNAAAALDSLSPRLVPTLQKELTLMKRTYPAEYQREVNGGNILELIAVRMQNGMVEAVAKNFAIVHDKIVAQPNNKCTPIGSLCLIYTPNPGVPEFVASKPVWGDTATKIIDQLMLVGRHNDPSVGGPMAVLAIDSSGARWLRQSGCRDISR